MGKIYENWEERKKMRREGELWIETILQLKQPLENQISEISDFIKKNPLNNYKIENPHFQIILDFEEINNLNNNSITHFLQNKYKLNYSESIKLFGQMKNTVRIINTSSNLYKSSFDELKNNSNIHYEEFKKSFTAFRKHLATYLDELNNLNSEKKVLREKFIKLIDKHITPHQENGNLNLYELSDIFFPNFFYTCHEDRMNSQIIICLDLGTDCDQAIRNLKSERKYLIEKQINIQNSYKQCLSILNDISLKLKIK